MSAEAIGTFLSLCSKRLAGEHVEVTAEPISDRLLLNRKPIITYDRTTTQEGDCFSRVSYCLSGFSVVPVTPVTGVTGNFTAVKVLQPVDQLLFQMQMKEQLFE